MSRQFQFDRRRLLTAMGLGSGSLFLPSLLNRQRARAATPPKRLLLNFTQHGPHYDNWAMRNPGLPDSRADWEFSLATRPENEWSPILKPLYRHREKLLIIDGLALTSAFAEPKRTNNHNMGTSHMFTGALMNEGGYSGDGTGGDSSIDQIVADQIAVEGRMRSLYYATGNSWTPIFKGKTELTAEKDPSQAYYRLFPQGSKSGGMPDEPTTPAAKLDAARADMMAMVREEYRHVSQRLSGDDRRKLSDHLDMVADLEKQIAAAGSFTCSAPGQDSDYLFDPNERQKRHDLFRPLLASAFACDMTRVAALVNQQWKPQEFGANAGDTHQDIAHSAKPGSTGSGAQGMTKYYTKEAENFAKLLDSLDAVEEAGGTLLDNTCVLWGCELANGPHDLYRLMFVMAGSAGGHFKTGRYLKYAETEPRARPTWYGAGDGDHGPPHSKLLVSVLQAMGVERNALPVTKAGVTDLTGPLPRLRA